MRHVVSMIQKSLVIDTIHVCECLGIRWGMQLLLVLSNHMASSIQGAGVYVKLVLTYRDTF